MAKKESKQAQGKRRLAILILILILVIVAVVLIVNKNKKPQNQPENPTTVQEEGGSKTNISEELKKEKTFFGYQVSNTVLKEAEGEATFITTLKNTTENTIGNESIYIIFKSKTGEELYKMEVYVPAIEPGKTLDLNSTIAQNVIDAYDIEIAKK